MRKADVVVSILPANLHHIVAKACINEGIHMVTASYMSTEVKDLHQAATNAGVTVLNEVGLDPGKVTMNVVVFSIFFSLFDKLL